jgi:GTP cyclohydrolase FolE2
MKAANATSLGKLHFHKNLEKASTYRSARRSRSLAFLSLYLIQARTELIEFFSSKFILISVTALSTCPQSKSIMQPLSLLYPTLVLE